MCVSKDEYCITEISKRHSICNVTKFISFRFRILKVDDTSDYSHSWGGGGGGTWLFEAFKRGL